MSTTKHGLYQQTIVIPPLSEWKPSGESEDPTARLYISFHLFGCNMHAEAYALQIVDGEQKVVAWPDQCDGIFEFAGVGRFQTTEFNGRAYGIFVTPGEE